MMNDGSPHIKSKKFASPAGNRTPVSRVTGGDTYHYTTEDWPCYSGRSKGSRPPSRLDIHYCAIATLMKRKVLGETPTDDPRYLIKVRLLSKN